MSLDEVRDHSVTTFADVLMQVSTATLGGGGGGGKLIGKSMIILLYTHVISIGVINIDKFRRDRLSKKFF